MNVGSVFDVPNGRYYLGQHGESVLNGGVAYFTGVAGRGNTFKSTLMHYMVLAILDRYKSATSNVYDTEMSLTNERMYQLAQHLPRIAGVDLEREDRLLITDSTVMMGEGWFDALKDFGTELVSKENYKANVRTTPFLNTDQGGFVTAMKPLISEVDSLSMLTTSNTQDVFDDVKIGDKETNISAMTDARIKTQLINQLPAFTAAHGIYVLMSAHVGKQHRMDTRGPPPPKQLQYLKGDASFKNVPEKFSFLPNNLYYVHNVAVMQSADKTSEYPKNRDDKQDNDTDLQLLTVQNLRAKNGPTGMPVEIVVSQKEGLLMGLTEFNLLKNLDRYGLGGNVQNYYLELLPNVALSRTTIRGKLERDDKLKRAMEITAELAYMYHIGYRTENTIEKADFLEEELDRDLSCTAKELYEDLKAKGYDWDVLLNTRGFWVFKEDEEGYPPFLSTMDLLRMRAGLYHPYWLPPLEKVSPCKTTKEEVGLRHVDNSPTATAVKKVTNSDIKKKVKEITDALNTTVSA